MHECGTAMVLDDSEAGRCVLSKDRNALHGGGDVVCFRNIIYVVLKVLVCLDERSESRRRLFDLFVNT